MNWLKKAASPKLIKITLAVMAIAVVVMIAIGQYWGALLWGIIFLGNYLQYRTKN